MIKYEDECVSCGFPCLGKSCPNRNVKRIYCNKCGNEAEHIYYFDDQELCINCIEEMLEEVE